MDDVARSYSEIYFSPHLDNAVLSCGGRIVQEKGQVLVVTLFTGEPLSFSDFGKRLVRKGLVRGLMRKRREEDKKAAKLLGFDFVHRSFLEAIARKKRGWWQKIPNWDFIKNLRFLYPFRCSLFGSLNPQDVKSLLPLLKRDRFF